MAWFEEEPIDEIFDRLLEIWTWSRQIYDKAELSTPMQEKVTFVPLQKASSSSAILNGLTAYPDITDKVFEYLIPGDLLQLHRAVWPLRRLNKLGRFLPGLRELRHLGVKYWSIKVMLLPPSPRRANNTDELSRDAMKFVDDNSSSHFRELIYGKDASPNIQRLDSITKDLLVKWLDRRDEAIWRIARLGDRVFQQIQLFERIRRRHEVSDKDEREKLMAEECAMSDAIGERIDALRNGDDTSSCPLCFENRVPFHDEGCWFEWRQRRRDLRAGRNWRFRLKNACLSVHTLARHCFERMRGKRRRRFS